MARGQQRAIRAIIRDSPSLGRIATDLIRDVRGSASESAALDMDMDMHIGMGEAVMLPDVDLPFLMSFSAAPPPHPSSPRTR